jgi:hypothetical protein
MDLADYGVPVFAPVGTVVDGVVVVPSRCVLGFGGVGGVTS